MRIREILFEARIYNQDILDRYLNNYSRDLPKQAQEFIKRIIIKASQDPRNQIKPTLKPDATEWDKKDLVNGTLVSFILSEELRNDLVHIWDWLHHPDITEQDLDSLRGIQNIDIAYEHANRFFARLNKKASSDEDESGLETIMSWPDGFKLVKLNTAQCLNREGKLMQHCVGSYAEEIENGTEILSLRDPQNNPHVTIEKNENDILQIKGKNNKAPIEKYHKYIVDYLNKNNFDEIYDLKNIGLIKVNDKIYELNNLPDNLTIADDLELRRTNLTKLPENLTVYGDVDICQCPIKELSKGMKISGGLYASNSALESLPDDLEVGSSIIISGTKIKELPKSWEGKTINGSLYITDCPINELPENLTIKGSLDISECPIKELPEHFTINCFLDFRGTSITKLPDTLKVSGKIYISRNMILTYIPNLLKNKIKAI